MWYLAPASKSSVCRALAGTIPSYRNRNSHHLAFIPLGPFSNTCHRHFSTAKLNARNGSFSKANASKYSILITELPFAVWIGVFIKPMRCKWTGPPTAKPMAWASHKNRNMINDWNYVKHYKRRTPYQQPRETLDLAHPGKQTADLHTACSTVRDKFHSAYW